MTKEATPLCSTCSVHEKQSSKVNFMWGAGWAFVVIIGTIVAILMAGQESNSEKIGINSERIAQHELKMDRSIHNVEQTLTIMSINQKRQMKEAGIEYIDPERVPHPREEW